MNTKKILIVEDDAAMIKILAHTLEKEGFTVLQARDGKLGLDTALQELPDLLLLDLLLPSMPGLEILKNLQSDEHGRKIPVMILTNLDENNEIYQAAQQAKAAYVIKSNSSLSAIVSAIKERLA